MKTNLPEGFMANEGQQLRIIFDKLTLKKGSEIRDMGQGLSKEIVEGENSFLKANLRLTQDRSQGIKLSQEIKSKNQLTELQKKSYKQSPKRGKQNMKQEIQNEKLKITNCKIEQSDRINILKMIESREKQQRQSKGRKSTKVLQTSFTQQNDNQQSKRRQTLYGIKIDQIQQNTQQLPRQQSKVLSKSFELQKLKSEVNHFNEEKSQTQSKHTEYQAVSKQFQNQSSSYLDYQFDVQTNFRTNEQVKNEFQIFEKRKQSRLQNKVSRKDSQQILANKEQKQIFPQNSQKQSLLYSQQKNQHRTQFNKSIQKFSQNLEFSLEKENINSSLIDFNKSQQLSGTFGNNEEEKIPDIKENRAFSPFKQKYIQSKHLKQKKLSSQSFIQDGQDLNISLQKINIGKLKKLIKESQKEAKNLSISNSYYDSKNHKKISLVQKKSKFFEQKEQIKSLTKTNKTINEQELSQKIIEGNLKDRNEKGKSLADIIKFVIQGEQQNEDKDKLVQASQKKENNKQSPFQLLRKQFKKKPLQITKSLYNESQ